MATSSDSASPANQLGSGLVEVSAVATLIGAPIAESLTVGLRSAACLPWASMSAFGLLHVAKAAMAAAVPDWLRDSMGLQNDNVVAAIGFCLPLKANKQARRREDLGDVQAISLSSIASPKGIPTAPSPPGEGSVKKSRLFRYPRIKKTKESIKNFFGASNSNDTICPFCVYTMDRTTKLALETIPPAEMGEGIVAHEFIPDRAGQHKAWKDTLVLAFSILKLSEVVTLQRLGSTSLHWFTAVPWAYGLLCGTALVMSGLSRDAMSARTGDIIAGRLPSALHLGGDGKILIGLPDNVRRNIFWKFMWYLYSLAAMVGVFGTFLVLTRHPPAVVYTWMAFQILWLCMRTVIYYFVESAVGARQGLVVSRTWDESSYEMRNRVFRLCIALSKQQATVHPRGAEAYQHDLMDSFIMRRHFDATSWNITEELVILDPRAIAALEVLDVIGDPVMRTIIWMKGKQLNNSDIYDSALAFVRSDHQTLAIPCVRVFACNCTEALRMRYRGDSHGSVCKNKIWVLWIPARTTDKSSANEEEHFWVYAHGPRTNGTLRAESVPCDKLDQRLAAHEWNVCFTKVQDLDPVISISREASKLLYNVLRLLDVDTGEKSSGS